VSDLSATLERLRKKSGLSRRQLEQVSGVSEETIKGIEYANNDRPTPETLKKISTGLATNRAVGRIDQDAADMLLTQLMESAGYVPKIEHDPATVATGFEAELAAMGYDAEEEAPLWAALTTELARRQGESRRKLLEMFRAMAEMSRD
jgi:transcriptional regulator with XRE-family HTH domain